MLRFVRTGPCLSQRLLAARHSHSFSADDVVKRMESDPKFAQSLGVQLGPEAVEKLEAASLQCDGATVPAPTQRQIFYLCIRSAVPFVGFGIFDNMVMLTVGDAIDATFGVTMGFSTLAAAGFGQCVSDATGIILQGLIERFSDSLGLPHPHLTRQQMELSHVKSWVQFARTLGIVLGCLLGMFPLIFLNTTRRCIVDAVKETLPDEQRKRFDAVLKHSDFQEGEKLMTCGTRNDHIYIILQGEVEVVGRDNFDKPIEVCTLGPGSMVGELEVVNNHPCVADVIASELVRTQAIHRDDFLAIIGEGNATEEVFRNNVNTSSRYVWYRMKMEKSYEEMPGKTV